MNAAKHDKVCEFYAFSVELANQLSNATNVTPKVIETLLDAGNSNKLSDSTKIKDLKEINKNIDQSKVIKGMSKMISDVINEVVSNNSAELMRTIAVSNKLVVSGAKGASFSFKNITQSVLVETKVEAEFAQKVTTKIQNEIANKIKDNIDTATKQLDRDSKNINSSESGGTTLGGMVSTLGDAWGKTMDTVAKVLTISAGNSMEQSTSKDINQELKETFNLNQNFNYEKNDEAKSAISNVLKTENLAKCAADSKMANEIDLSKIDVTGPIEIENVKQEAIVKDIMKCAFNQEIMNDIASKVINDFDKLIKALIENVNESLSTEQKTAVQGDIYAVGTAGAAVLEGAGTAAQGLGEGISTAAQGTGKGISSAAEGVGTGIGSAMSGLAAPLIAGAIFLLLASIGYVIYKKASSSSPDTDNEEGNDE
jgi:hypothetical protein